MKLSTILHETVLKAVPNNKNIKACMQNLEERQVSSRPLHCASVFSLIFQGSAVIATDSNSAKLGAGPDEEFSGKK